MFGDAIRAVRPDLLRRPHPRSLSDMKLKVRGTEDATTDLRVDCQVRLCCWREREKGPPPGGLTVLNVCQRKLVSSCAARTAVKLLWPAVNPALAGGNLAI